MRTETQMRNRDRPRLLRVIHEIALGIVNCIFSNNLDRVLVCPYCSVRTEDIKQGANCAWFLGGELSIVVQAGVRDIVVNPDSKVILGSGLLDFVEDSFRHGWGKFLRCETVAAPDDLRSV